MLSICIGIYNWNVSQLVKDLHQQATKLLIDFEIILIDDASGILYSKNDELAQLSNVLYFKNNQNIGRAAIRNKLANQAKFPNLLFMDCDTAVIDDNYLKKYVSEIDSAEVISGGYAYPQQKPHKPYILRWYYGKYVEEQPAAMRNRNPNFSFSTFNFLIKKSLFNQLQFDESLSGYGHEDTLFGWQLLHIGINVRHIDNPLLHEVQIETPAYIQQTEQAIQNLLHIYEKIEDKEQWIGSISLLRFMKKIEKKHLLYCLRVIFNLTQSIVKWALTSYYPSLRLFNLYKAGYLSQMLYTHSISLLDK